MSNNIFNKIVNSIDEIFSCMATIGGLAFFSVLMQYLFYIEDYFNIAMFVGFIFYFGVVGWFKDSNELSTDK